MSHAAVKIESARDVAPLVDSLRTQVRHLPPVQRVGTVTGVAGLIIESDGPNAGLGDLCIVRSVRDEFSVRAEVVGFREHRVLLMPLGDTSGLHVGCEVALGHRPPLPRTGPEMLGRVLDALGKPIDDLGLLPVDPAATGAGEPPHPLRRQRIKSPFVTGVRAIDAFIPFGRGQRLGLFAGSGVGKSTLMGMVARASEADVVVIALVGERGREVREFIEKDLGPEGMKRAVVVVATSDTPAPLRLRAAFTATAIAEAWRDAGKNVLFMMDSVTRFAMAQREVGLAIGEPPASKGYTPSVFALLPRLLERAGNGARGSITGFYTVLVEGDDFNEPICDAVRGILDGHILLTRELAQRNHYPAIDVLKSISRVMSSVTDQDHRADAGVVRRLLATYDKARDLVNIGAYVKGSDPEIDAALDALPALMAFLQQGIEFAPLDETRGKMRAIAE